MGPVQHEKVVTKPVHAAQPIQQVPGTQQPEYRHEQVVVEDHAVSQDQVLPSMGGGHSDDQLPLATTQPDVRGGGRCTPHDDGMSTTRVSHQDLVRSHCRYHFTFVGTLVLQDLV